MTSDLPRPGVFAVRGLHMDTVVERMFHTETEEDRKDWLQAIEMVRDRLQEPGDGQELLPFTSDKKVTRAAIHSLLNQPSFPGNHGGL